MLISLEKYLSTHVTALLNLLAIFPVQASPLRRVSLRRRDGWGEEEKKTRRERWEWEARPLPYNVRFSGSICGFVVLAKQGECLDDFEGYWEDNSIN